jgi:hypothetical protein
LVTAAALGAYPPLEGTLRPLSLVLGGLALAFLAAGLAGRWTAPVATGLTLLGAQYAVLFSAGPEAVDEWTPFYAAGFLLSAELSFWSTEPRVPAWSDLEVVLRRVGTVLAACLGAAGIAAVVIIAAGASLGDSLVAEAVGLGSAVTALAFLAGLVRRLR